MFKRLYYVKYDYTSLFIESSATPHPHTHDYNQGMALENPVLLP